MKTGFHSHFYATFHEFYEGQSKQQLGLDFRMVAKFLAGLEKSTCPLDRMSTSCCRASRNFDCFQCKLLNLQAHMDMCIM